jgi:hypothetical protein
LVNIFFNDLTDRPAEQLLVGIQGVNFAERLRPPVDQRALVCTRVPR